MTTPSFMGSGLARGEMVKGDSVQTTMSPLQAIHLLQVMIDQKIANPDYQDPSIDLDSRAVERRKQLDELRRTRNDQNSHILLSNSNQKHGEVARAISLGAASMSILDASELIDETLTAMSLK